MLPPDTSLEIPILDLQALEADAVTTFASQHLRASGLVVLRNAVDKSACAHALRYIMAVAANPGPDITEEVHLLKGRIFIKGNIDPVNTLLRGDTSKVKEDVTQVLGAAMEMDGFILSSACSVAPPAPPDNLKYMVDLCREITAQ